MTRASSLGGADPRRLVSEGQRRHHRVLALSSPIAEERFTSYFQEACLGVMRYVREHTAWELISNDFRVSGSIDLRTPRDLKGLGADGVIVMGIGAIDEDVAALASHGLPMVLTCYHGQGDRFPTVAPDDVEAGRMAARHLLGQGFRHFALFPPGLFSEALRKENSDRWWRRCREGLTEIIAAAGYEYREFPAFEIPGNASELQARELYIDDAACWLAGLPHPLGAIAASDRWAAAVVRACRKARLESPRDVGVIGFNNDPVTCHSVIPPLSSVDLNGERLGYRAAALLDRYFRTGAWGSLLELSPPGGVVARLSTDILAVEDGPVRIALQFVRDHYAEPITTGDVARAARSPVTHLCERFRRRLGFTVGDEIRRLWVERAKELLANTSLSLKEIASVTGLGNRMQLSHVFARRAGIPPGRWRAEHGAR